MLLIAQFTVKTIKYAPLRLANIAHTNDEGNQRDIFDNTALPDTVLLKKRAEHLFDDLQRRTQCLDVNVNAAKYTIRELSSPTLIAAMMISKSTSEKNICEKYVEDELGYGPVDYVMMKR